MPANGDDLLFLVAPGFQPLNNNLLALTPNSLMFSNATAITLGGNQITLGPATFAGAAMTFGRSSTTATATNATPHGLVAGQLINVSGSVTPFNGIYQIASAPSATTLTFTVANAGATVGNGSVARAATVENLNATGGRDVNLALSVQVNGGTQQWNIVTSNGVLLLSGNLTGSSNIIISTHDTRSAVPALRLAGTNAGFTGHFLPGSGTSAGLLLMHPASMPAGNIDLGAGDRNVWLQAGAGIGTYTMGFGGGTNAINFRNAGQGGLKVMGGNGAWDPGGGGHYSTIGMTNPRVRFARSLVDTNGLSFGNDSSRLILSTNGMTIAFAEGGLAATPVVSLRFALGDDGSARNFTVGEGGNSWPGVLALTRAATGGNLGGKTIVDAAAAVSVSSMDQLFNGSLELRAGTLVLDGISWADFAADRSGGNGNGANQWMITNGAGFAARGSLLTIPNDTSGGLSASTFDINFQLGHGAPDTNGLLFANRPVVMARNTTLTGRRQIAIAPTGQGLYPSNPVTVIPTLSASFSGTGSLMIVGGNYGTGVTAPTNLTAEVIVSGTNTWSGAVTNVSINGPIFNSGPGGLHVRDALVRFDGDAALPSGNGGNPSLIAALQRNSTDYGFGFLFAGGAAEKVYDLPAGARLMIGSLSTAQDPGVLGATEGLAKLQNSTVLVHDGADGFTPASGFSGYPLALLVRDGGVFTLGDTTAGPVRFVPSKGQDAASSLSAMSVSDAAAAGFTNRTLVKRGEGTLILRNVSYTDVAETGNKTAAFTWHIGRGAGGNSGSATYFDGAVRGLAPGDAAATSANSLKNLWVGLRGGVYEIDNSGGGSGTFNLWVTNTVGPTNISIGNISGTTAIGGGGFAAYGGDVVVDLNNIGTRDMLSFNLSNGGFVQGADPLLFGSQTANATIEFYDSLNLNGGTRDIRVIDNTNATTDRAVISGTVTGLSSSALLKTGNGLLELRGTNTYAGGTIVSNGVLIVNSGNGSGTGTNSVSVAAGASFGGVGTVSGQVSMASGATLLLGATTNPAVATLSMRSLTCASVSIYFDITNATGVAGTDWDLINLGNGSGSLTIQGGSTITLIMRNTNAIFANFDGTMPHSWRFLAAASVNGLAANTFVATTNQFAPGLDGTLSVTQGVDGLYLHFEPNIPVDLTLRATQSAALLDVGTPLTYTLTVSNAGPLVSAGLVLSNVLGATVAYVGSSGGGVHSGGVVTWSLPALPVGATTSVTLTVNAALVQGAFTNRTYVRMPSRADPNPANNVTNLVATSQCPGAPSPFLNAVGNRGVLAFQTVAFNVVASNSDCSTPFLEIAGKPAGATFATATSGYVRTGTFSWTPGPADVGSHPLQFRASNAGSSTQAFSMLVQVGQAGEPTNASGIPLSQTNWHVSITNIAVPATGSATMTWVTVTGVLYDVYRTTNAIGSGATTWTLITTVEAAGTNTEIAAQAAGTQQFFQVTLRGQSVGTNGAWGVIRVPITAGPNLIGPPLVSDGALSGEWGASLAVHLAGDDGGSGDGVGDELYVLQANGTWQTYYLDASGLWRNGGDGSPASGALLPGQGAMLLRLGSPTHATFRGPVGNTGIATNEIAEGWSIVALSQGRTLSLASAFEQTVVGAPAGSFDETDADLVVLLDSATMTWQRNMRLPDNTWFNLTTYTAANTILRPGQAAYYLRRAGAGPLAIRF